MALSQNQVTFASKINLQSTSNLTCPSLERAKETAIERADFFALLLSMSVTRKKESKMIKTYFFPLLLVSRCSRNFYQRQAGFIREMKKNMTSRPRSQLLQSL